MWIHLTARASVGRPLVDAREKVWLWRALRKRWPVAFAACLMPDHLHLLMATDQPERDHASLARLLGAFSRCVTRAGWVVARPEPVRSPDHARRTVRYIHLNPCRAKLADDPLAWPWSTHRGVIGAELDPWVTAERLARALGSPVTGFASKLHAFVSGDPSVSPLGTPFPAPAPRRASPELPMSSIVVAASAATPWSTRPAAFHRAAVLLAVHQGWCNSGTVASAIGISACSVRRLAVGHDPALLAAAALCLGDERLRREWPCPGEGLLAA